MRKIMIGDWVRVGRGIYQGSEGEVLDLYDARDSGPEIAVIDSARDNGPIDVAVNMVEHARRG